MALWKQELENTKIDPDEPVFVLRAKDLTAPMAVRAWANRAEELGTIRPEKLEEARAIAREMIAWQNQHGGKLPD